MTENGNGLLTESKMRAHSERTFVIVEVKGELARLRSLTAAEIRRVRDSLNYPSGQPVPGRHNRIAELLLVQCLVDENDRPILTEASMQEFFDSLDGGFLESLCVAATNHSGWVADYTPTLIEEAKKN